MTHNINIHNLDEDLLGNRLNDFCLDTLCFLRNVSLIETSIFH